MQAYISDEKDRICPHSDRCPFRKDVPDYIANCLYYDFNCDDCTYITHNDHIEVNGKRYDLEDGESILLRAYADEYGRNILYYSGPCDPETYAQTLDMIEEMERTKRCAMDDSSAEDFENLE